MSKVNQLLALAVLAAITATAFTSCKKREGFTDSKAINYDSEAKTDDGSCTYTTVTINMNNTGATNDGDVIGNGGSGSKTVDWTNHKATADYNMDITATGGGSFQLIVKDSVGTTVLDETLIKGVGDDSKSGGTAPGIPGTWKVTIVLTNFNGDGRYSLSPGN